MKITSLKDLKQIIKVCRDGGVTGIELDGVKLTLQPKPITKAPVASIDYSNDFPEASVPVPQYRPVDLGVLDKVDTEELTPDQLMFYSAVGPTDQLIGEQ